MNRRFPAWILPTVALAAIVVVAAWLGAAWYLREPPNYTLIEPGLYVGGYVAAPPPGATAVLNLDHQRDPYQTAVHRHEPIYDAEPAPSLDWIREQVDFITSQLSDQRTVYVHCANGISRGPMVTTAYLMQRYKLTRDEALARLRAKRPDVRPNRAFMKRLAEWEAELTAGRPREE